MRDTQSWCALDFPIRWRIVSTGPTVKGGRQPGTPDPAPTFRAVSPASSRLTARRDFRTAGAKKPAHFSAGGQGRLSTNQGDTERFSRGWSASRPRRGQLGRSGSQTVVGRRRQRTGQETLHLAEPVPRRCIPLHRCHPRALHHQRRRWRARAGCAGCQQERQRGDQEWLFHVRPFG